MRTLVACEAGYIGRHTNKTLADMGQTLVADGMSTGHRNLVGWRNFMPGDIQDTQLPQSCIRNHVKVMDLAEAHAGTLISLPEDGLVLTV